MEPFVTVAAGRKKRTTRGRARTTAREDSENGGSQEPSVEDLPRTMLNRSPLMVHDGPVQALPQTVCQYSRVRRGSLQGCRQPPYLILPCMPVELSRDGG